MSGVALRAPAKLNLTLEVLGRRPDGYHEIRSIMTTCSLYDDVCVEHGHGLIVTADPDFDPAGMPASSTEENTAEKALAIMVQERARLTGISPPGLGDALRQGIGEVALRLHKRIPAAAGLGGGSSDGAAALLALDRLWGLNLGPARLRSLAAGIGSDCPFFVDGGVQYAGGRGDMLEALPALPSAALSFCIVRPPLTLPAKTAQMYRLLRPEHYSSGEQSDRLARRLSGGWAGVDANELGNVFDAVAGEAYGGLDGIRSALRACGALAIHLCGAGPAVYGLFDSLLDAEFARATLSADGYATWAVTAPGP